MASMTNALDFADRERRAAFAHGADVPAGRGVQGGELEVVSFESACHRLDFGLDRVFEMTACAENLDALETSSGNLLQKFRCQFS